MLTDPSSCLQIKDIKEDIEYYLENCREPDFEENELLYEDIDGLDDMLQELSNVSLLGIVVVPEGQFCSFFLSFV